MAKYSRLDFKTALPQIEKDMDEREKIVDERFDGLLDFFYPVGTIYETADVNFNPNETWGGTWEKIEGRVLVGHKENDTYFGNVGNQGGHKGSFYHTHGSRSLSGTMRVLQWNSAASGIITKSSAVVDRTASSGDKFGSATYTINATHTHDAVGSSSNNVAAISNMPPYEVAVIWKRIE